MDLVRLQKLDGLWTLDEQFVSLFENSENIRNHPNLATVRSFVSESGMYQEIEGGGEEGRRGGGEEGRRGGKKNYFALSMLFLHSVSEMAETLWATSLALAFFHSDDMLTRKDEWELLVDKSLESIKKVLLGIHTSLILFLFDSIILLFYNFIDLKYQMRRE